MLSQAEKTTISNIIAREGGLSSLFTQIQAMEVASRGASALATLAPAITVTVQNWATLAAYIASPEGVSIASVINAIEADSGAQNATRLGPLFVALYAAIKARGQ